MTQPVPAKGKLRRPVDYFEEQLVLEKKGNWALVRWAGYHPSCQGGVATSLRGGLAGGDMGEQVRMLKNTEAWRTWERVTLTSDPTKKGKAGSQDGVWSTHMRTTTIIQPAKYGAHPCSCTTSQISESHH